jgi:hypothetical protein
MAQFPAQFSVRLNLKYRKSSEANLEHRRNITTFFLEENQAGRMAVFGSAVGATSL